MNYHVVIARFHERRRMFGRHCYGDLQRDELVRRVQKSRCDAQQYARMMGAYMILVVSKGQRGLFPKSVPRM